MMVGDGISDAPALRQADVGAAVHNAREISLDAADVLLTRSELKGISELVRLFRISRRTILQNLSLSLGYNTLTIPLAMMGWINPLLAAAAMAGSSVTVVLNSLRQKRQFPVLSSVLVLICSTRFPTWNLFHKTFQQFFKEEFCIFHSSHQDLFPIFSICALVLLE